MRRRIFTVALVALVAVAGIVGAALLNADSSAPAEAGTIQRISAQTVTTVNGVLDPPATAVATEQPAATPSCPGQPAINAVGPAPTVPPGSPAPSPEEQAALLATPGAFGPTSPQGQLSCTEGDRAVGPTTDHTAMVQPASADN